MKKTVVLSLAGLGVLAACKSISDASNEVAEDFKNQTISLDYMDQKVKPQDDFFMFANGTWVKENPVPPSESRWGSFNELDQANMEKLTKILEEAKKGSSEDHGTNLIGNYYASYIDMDRRNELGTKPIEALLKEVRGFQSKEELPQLIAKHHRLGVGSLFHFGVSQDIKDVENHIASFGQGGLTLPNRDYYLEDDKKDIRDAYRQYIIDLFMEFGESEGQAKRRAESIMNFETSMAEQMLRPAEMRNPENRYHKVGKDRALKAFGEFKFEEYLNATGIATFEEMNVGQPDYARFINELYTGASIEDWRNYLEWKVLENFAPHLGQNFVDLTFDFYGKTMSGTSEMKPIKERAIKEITRMEFGELLGKAFVERHYSQDAQETINELVDNLLIVFRERIDNLEWMSAETKTQALKKLNAIGRKLGFPDKWTDFSGLSFSPEEYVMNIITASNFSYEKNLSKLNEPVDKSEWGMPAHMVNAYYHPLLNEIAFPAGIMQPPFFSANYEDAVNYGRIGMVIGHEFTHGFDDNGSKFDASGNFENWWTPSDRTMFEERTAILGKTFSGFCPIDGHCVNPDLTMGENIADLGGLTLAYHAYTRTKEFKSGVKRNGFTPAQRFFIAYAQLWKINFTDAELKKRIATDPHSPGMYRVNGPLMNCPEFFEAFNVQEGDPMRNENANVAKIW